MIRIPQRKISSLYALHPEESWRNKVGDQVPFGKEISLAKEVIKKENGSKKKG